MPCKVSKNADGQVTMIVCFKLRGPKAGQTCDAPMCDAHAYRCGADADLCPPHRDLVLRETEAESKKAK